MSKNIRFITSKIWSFILKCCSSILNFYSLKQRQISALIVLILRPKHRRVGNRRRSLIIQLQQKIKSKQEIISKLEQELAQLQKKVNNLEAQLQIPKKNQSSFPVFTPPKGKLLGIITANHEIIYPRYAPEEFVGRKWLVEEVELFRDAPDKRHLIIVGEPGSGKSAFIAYLAEKWNCPRHFIRVDNIGGVTGCAPRAFLMSLGFQLYQKYGREIFPEPDSGKTTINVRSIEDKAKVIGRFVEELYSLPFLPVSQRDINLKVGTASGESKIIGEKIKRLVNDPLFLDEKTLLHIALTQPLQKIQELYPEEKVVIFIDALDESLQHSGTKVVDFIPKAAECPSNLRLVMTSRLGDHLESFQTQDRLYLDNEQSEYKQKSLTDAQAYINKRFESEPLSNLFVKLSNQKRNDYVVRFQEISKGNFLYLYHFLNQLDRVYQDTKKNLEQILEQIGNVPKGLDEIYEKFAILKIKKNNSLRDWTELYLPLLGTIAVIREPVGVKQLAKFAGVKVTNVDYLIAEIQQFLDIIEINNEKRYRLYHISFNEFLLDSSRHSQPGYQLDAEKYHRKIAFSYRGDCIDYSQVDWSQKDDYAFLHLTYHFQNANSKEELYTLLTDSPKWMEAKSKRFGDIAYVEDLELAINGEDKNGKKNFDDPIEDSNQLRTLVKLHTARQVVNQRVKIPNLKTLVWLDRKVEALSQTRQKKSLEKKFNDLLTIHYVLLEKNQFDDELLKEAKQVADEMSHNCAKARALIQLGQAKIQAGREVKDLFDEAEKVVEEIKEEEGDKAEILYELAAAKVQAKDFIKAKKIATIAVQTVKEIECYEAKVLGEWAEIWQKVGCEDKAKDLFNAALKDAGEYEDRLLELAVAYPSASSDDTNLVFNKVKQIAYTREGWEQADILVELANALIKNGHKDEAISVLEKVYEIINSTESESTVILDQADNFSIAQNPDILIPNQTKQVKILSKVAGLTQLKDNNEATKIFTKAQEIADAIKETDAIKESKYKSFALNKLAEALEEAKRFSKAEEIASKAQRVALATLESRRKPIVLSQLATILAQAERDKNEVNAVFREAENSVRSLEKNSDKAKALSKLALGLVQSKREANREEIFFELYEIIDEMISDIADKKLDKTEVHKLITEVHELIKDLAHAEKFSKLEEIANTIHFDYELREKIFSELTVAYAHAEDFSKAEEVIKKIKENSPEKAITLSRLAAAYMDTDAQKANCMFEEAKNLALNIIKNSRNKTKVPEILLELATAYIRANKFDDAREIASLIEGIQEELEKAIILSKLAAAYALVKNFTEAKNITTIVEKFDSTNSGGLSSLLIKRELAAALAQVKSFKKAFNIFEFKENIPSEFLAALMEWQPAFEQIEAGLTANLLQESIHIFGWQIGWEYPDWRYIDTLIRRDKEILNNEMNTT